MPAIGTLAVVLTAQEVRTFLPGGMHAELLGLAPRAYQIDPLAQPPGEVQRQLARIAPEVLVACWKAPALPVEPPAGLRYVCYLGGSVKKLVTRAHLEQGLLVSNWGGSISRVVAESALMMALASLRRAGGWLPAMQRDGAWKDDRLETASLFGRRVGIHGFGRVAQELSKLLRPFGTDLGIFSPETDSALYAAHQARRVESLEELFSRHEIVFELAPLIPATVGLVTEALLRQIPPGGVFVNLGRGAVVDERGLLRVAREGNLRLALDVYATEPLPADSPLRGLSNVILSPHIGGPTTDRCRDAGAFGLRNLRAYAAGRPIESAVTPAIFDASS